MMSKEEAARSAQEHAALAAETAATLKSGTWDSVQALATLSIAESLIARADD